MRRQPSTAICHPPAAAWRWRGSGLAAMLIGLAVTPAAQAWGDQGHEVVAAIAYARLTPATRQAVDALLAADKDALTAPDFISRATWAEPRTAPARTSTPPRRGTGISSTSRSTAARWTRPATSTRRCPMARRPAPGRRRTAWSTRCCSSRPS